MKKLLKGFSNKSGRSGKILAYTKGGRCKRIFRFLDFKRRLFDLSFVVCRIEYDPNRSSFLLLICYINGFFSYILSPHNVLKDSILENGFSTNLSTGDCSFLKNIPAGSLVHCIEIRPGQGAKLARAAGAFGILQRHDSVENLVTIRLRSGVQYNLSAYCLATIGTVSKIWHRLFSLRKAGRSKHLGFKARTRGTAKNPVDHPNGGRTRGGKVFKSRWGKIVKCGKTGSSLKKNLYVNFL